jgi:hypothetical protein
VPNNGITVKIEIIETGPAPAATEQQVVLWRWVES